MENLTSNVPNSELRSQSITTSDERIEKFWSFIEKNMGCVIPKYLQNILTLCGFDNAQSIKTLTESDLDNLANFAKTKMKKYIPEGADLQEYYHIFSTDPEEFEILLGHMRLLQELVKYVNLTMASHGPAFFDINKEPNVKKIPSRRFNRRDLQDISSINLPTIRNTASDKVPTSKQTGTAETTSNLVEEAAKDCLTTSANNRSDSSKEIPSTSPSSMLSEATSSSNLLDLTLVVDSLKLDSAENKIDKNEDESFDKVVDSEPSPEYAQYKAEMQKQIFDNIVNWMEKNVPVLLKKYSTKINMAILEENLQKDELSFIFHCPICPKVYQCAVLERQLSDGNSQRYFLTSNATRHITQHGIEFHCFEPKPKHCKNKKNTKGVSKRKTEQSLRKNKCKKKSNKTIDSETSDSDVNLNEPLSKIQKM